MRLYTYNLWRCYRQPLKRLQTTSEEVTDNLWIGYRPTLKMLHKTSGEVTDNRWRGYIQSPNRFLTVSRKVMGFLFRGKGLSPEHADIFCRGYKTGSWEVPDYLKRGYRQFSREVMINSLKRLYLTVFSQSYRQSLERLWGSLLERLWT